MGSSRGSKNTGSRGKTTHEEKVHYISWEGGAEPTPSPFGLSNATQRNPSISAENMPGRVDNVPFARAQHIGSLLRPTKLLDVRMRYENGEADYKTELKPVEDEAISDIIQLQRSVGLKCLSDGEFRRHMFCDGFHEHLDGFECVPVLKYTCCCSAPRLNAKSLPTRSVNNPPRSIFKMYVPDVRAFVDSHAKRMAPTWICKGTIKRKDSSSPYEEQFKSMLQFTTPDEIKHIKMTTAAPEWYHLRHSSEFAFTKDAYPEDGEVGYFRDIAAAYREELKALYALGCRNVQVDDPLLAYFCDESMIKGMKDEGMDPEAELTKYIDLYNQCFAGRPKDMMVGVHLCRGNFKGRSTSLPRMGPPTDFTLPQMACTSARVAMTESRAGSSTSSTLMCTYCADKAEDDSPADRTLFLHTATTSVSTSDKIASPAQAFVAKHERGGL